MTPLERCYAEQAACAAYLADPAKLAEWCARYGATEEQARNGAMQGWMDWKVEAALIQAEKPSYTEFLEAKRVAACPSGFEPGEINPMLFPFCLL